MDTDLIRLYVGILNNLTINRSRGDVQLTEAEYFFYEDIRKTVMLYNSHDRECRLRLMKEQRNAAKNKQDRTEQNPKTSEGTTGPSGDADPAK